MSRGTLGLASLALGVALAAIRPALLSPWSGPPQRTAPPTVPYFSHADRRDGTAYLNLRIPPSSAVGEYVVAQVEGLQIRADLSETLRAFDATGSLVWSFAPLSKGPALLSRVAIFRGRLFVLTHERVLYAIGLRDGAVLAALPVDWPILDGPIVTGEAVHLILEDPTGRRVTLAYDLGLRPLPPASGR